MPQQISRRELLKIGTACLFLSPGRSTAQTDSVCLGVIADLHHGLGTAGDGATGNFHASRRRAQT